MMASAMQQGARRLGAGMGSTQARHFASAMKTTAPTRAGAAGTAASFGTVEAAAANQLAGAKQVLENASLRSHLSKHAHPSQMPGHGSKSTGRDKAMLGVAGVVVGTPILAFMDLNFGNCTIYHLLFGNFNEKAHGSFEERLRDGEGSQTIDNIRAARKGSMQEFKEEYWQREDPMAGKYDSKTWKNRDNHQRLVRSKSYKPGDGDLAIRVKSFRPQPSQKRTDLVYDADSGNVPAPKKSGKKGLFF